MDSSLLEHFRQHLLELKQALAESEANTADDTKPVKLDQSSVGRLSRMDAMQAQAMAQQSARRRKALMLATEKALIRIEQGDFGYCDSCDEPINPKRLEIDPTLTRCIDCADL